MKRTLAASFIFLLALCPNFLTASWSLHAFKDFAVTTEFSDYSYQESDGSPVYDKGQTIRYRVIINNNGNRPFKDLPVQATLVWDRSTVCSVNGVLIRVQAGEVLPGNPVSGPHLLTLGKDSYSFFDGFYTIPNTVCPNSARISLDAGRDNNDPSLVTGSRIVIH